MKFTTFERNAMFGAMKPETAKDMLTAEILAKMFAEYVLPHYMSDRFEPCGLVDGEMWFTNLDTGELVGWMDLWINCRFVEDCVANGGTLPEADEDDYTPEDWCAGDEDIII